MVYTDLNNNKWMENLLVGFLEVNQFMINLNSVQSSNVF